MMKASRTITIDRPDVEVRLHVTATVSGHYEAPSWECPGGQSFDVLSLDHCDVEFEKKPDEAEVIDGDWVPCGRWLFDFEITDHAGIVAYCKGWGVDPFEEIQPEDIEDDEPDGPDPDDLKDAKEHR